VFRDFKDLLDVEALRPWMQRYETHRAELLKIVQTRPQVVDRLVRVASASHDGAKNAAWRMPAASVSGFAELAREVRAAGSPELRRLMDDVEAVIGQGQGKSVEELKAMAAARLPPVPTGRPVPPHRMGRGPIVSPRPARRQADAPALPGEFVSDRREIAG
jgi:hypothetical protein